MKSVLEFLENNNSENKIIDVSGSITYKELKENGKRIGSFLSTRVNKNMAVPIYMEKGIKALELFVGVLYSGAFYSLLNTNLPKKRLIQIMDVLDSDFIITDKDHYECAKEYFENKEIILYEDIIKFDINEATLSNIFKQMLDIDPVYANFTSGSTGTPKGVLVSNRSIIDFINNFTQTFNITKDDVIANQAPFDFDVSVKDTTLIWAVSALCLISTFHGLDYKVPTSVNKILFSGEVMPLKHLNSWMKHLPDAMFVNLYGPTEITCNCTYHIIDKNYEYNKIPIGKPFNNESVFLLNENNELVTK